MDFMTAVKTRFAKYFDFKGRARRSEFWYFMLFVLIGVTVSYLIDGLLFGFESAISEGIVGSLFGIAIGIPTFAVGARRLHDTNRTGWWQLLPYASSLALIPGIILTSMAIGGQTELAVIALPAIIIGFSLILVAFLLQIIWLTLDGQKTDNRFGESPKY